MRRSRWTAGVGVVLAALLLTGCASRVATAPTPTVSSTHMHTASSTPPPVQRTVGAGTTLRAGDAAPAAAAGLPSLLPKGAGPSAVVAAPNVDGCNRSYGAATVCVPLRAPGGRPVTCAFLRAYHYLPLLVTKDPLRLLVDGGTAGGTVTVRITGGKHYLTGCAA